MNKKILKITVLLLICFFCTNVYAEGWPLEVSFNEYEFNVDGIRIKVYPIDSENIQEITETDENEMTSTHSYSQDIENYLNGIPARTIDVEMPDFQFYPIMKINQLDDVNTTFIGLNLNITKQVLEDLLSEEIDASTETQGFIAEVVALVNFDGVPSRYPNVLKRNIMKSFIDVFAEEMEYNDAIYLDDTNDIVLNTISIGINEETNQKEIIYTNDDYQAINYLDLIEFSSDTNKEYLLIHDLTDAQVEEIIARSTYIAEPENPETSNEVINNIVNNNTQEVKVADTGETIDKYKYIISIVVLGLGLFLVYKNTNKKKA